MFGEALPSRLGRYGRLQIRIAGLLEGHVREQVINQRQEQRLVLVCRIAGDTGIGDQTQNRGLLM